MYSMNDLLSDRYRNGVFSTCELFTQFIPDYESKWGFYDEWIAEVVGDQYFINSKRFEDVKKGETGLSASQRRLEIGRLMMESTCIVNKYEFETLKKSTEFEYNPIDNYDGHEEETFQTNEVANNNGTVLYKEGERNETSSVIGSYDSNKKELGSGSSNENVSSNDRSVKTGETTNLNEHSEGERVSSDETNTTTLNDSSLKNNEVRNDLLDEKTSNVENETTTTKKLVPYDSETYHNTEQEVSHYVPIDKDVKHNSSNVTNVDSNSSNEESSLSLNETKHIENAFETSDKTISNVDENNLNNSNSETTSESSNSLLTNENSETINQENRKSDEVVNNEINSNESARSQLVTRKLDKRGNMGTTSTQSMIVQEREVALFSLFQHIIMKFCEEHCMYVDDAGDWNDCITGESVLHYWC